MNQSRFAYVSDAVLLHAVFFAVAFLLLRLLLPALYSAIAAGIATVGFLSLYLWIKKRKKKAYDPTRAKDCFVQFCLRPDYALEYFSRVLGATVEQDWLIREDTLYAPVFSLSPVPFSSAADAYRYACEKGYRKLVYLTAAGLDADAKILTGLEGPTVEVLGEAKTFELMIEEVEILYRRKESKRRFDFVRHALDRKNARRYWGAALTLFAFAYLLPYAVYYLAVACLCTVLGVVCFFRPSDRKKPSSRQNSERA